MNFNLMHPAEQIVLLINRVYQKGLTTTSGGNLSILDSEGNLLSGSYTFEPDVDQFLDFLDYK